MAKENKQHWLNQKDDMFKIVLSNEDYKVQSPLPDDFGMTLGSEYSEPFDTGSMSEKWSQVFALSGTAQKIGLRMKKMFTNAEPTEISFDMDFVAYYDAKDEVFMPIVYLTIMTLGTEKTWDDVKRQSRDLYNKIQTTANRIGATASLLTDGGDAISELANDDQTNQYGNKLLGLIGLIESPKQVKVQFGNVMKWKNMYITSISTQFSNALDPDGYPMSARVSVTVTPEQYPVVDEMLSVYGLPS
jgi:hypothetical protein